MSIEITRASKADKIIIRNLTELYFHDFSEFEKKEVNEHGLFDYDDLDLFWLEQNRHAFLARYQGKIAGFALVKQGFYHERDEQYDEQLVDMVDFFVMRRYRRNGVGRVMARYCFEAVRGNWQVRTDEPNIAAFAFWRSAIAQYTNGKYETHTFTDSPGVAYYFES
jgi:predicted acetyltransferase